MAEIVDFGLQQHKIKMDSRYFENVLSVVAGDTGRRLEVQLLDTNGMVQDTTGLNLRLNAEIAGKATFTDATLVDAATGKYQLDLSNGMFLAPGNWQFQWLITDSAGKKLHSFAFTGNVGKNISEGGSQATNFYLNLEDLKAMQDDLVNGTIDSSILETNIAEKLTDLETQYAPKLTEVTAQLAQKASYADLNSALSAIVDESPTDYYNTLNSLKTAYPNGAAGTFLVLENQNIYTWSGTEWVSRGQFQNAKLPSDVAKSDGLRGLFRNEDYTPITNDLATYTSGTVATSLYVRKTPLLSGKLRIRTRVVSIATGTFYLLEKQENSDVFKVIGSKSVNLVAGINTIDTDLLAVGNGNEYFAFVGFRMYYKTVGGVGFYEGALFNTSVGSEGSLLTLVDKTTPFDFAYDLTYVPPVESDESLTADVTILKQENGTQTNQIVTLQNDVAALSSGGETSKIVPFNTLKFRASEGNFTESPNAYFMGRWFTQNIGGIDYVTTINQGSEIYAKFTGTSLVGVFKKLQIATPFIAVSIDGGAFTRIELITETITLATGLENEDHYVRVVIDALMEKEDKWNSFLGIGFKEFQATSVQSFKPENGVIWFFGDSITEGVNVLTTGANPTSNSALKAFPFIVANSLNAAGVRIGFGGTGFSTAGNGNVPKFADFVRYMANNKLETAQRPDAIVINFGTNDTASTVEQVTLDADLAIKRIQNRFPGVPIFMMQNLKNRRMAQIQSIVANNLNAYFIETASLFDTMTYTDGTHPDVAGHLKLGNHGANEIKKVLGSTYFMK